MKSIIVKELKMVLKEKGNFFFLLVMPIMFIVLFGSIFNNTDSSLSVRYIDQDQSSASKAFIKQIDHIKGFSAEKQAGSIQNQIHLIKDGKSTSLLVIPKGFGEHLKSGSTQGMIKLYRDAAADQTAGPIQSVLQNIISGYQQQHVQHALAASGMNHGEVDKLMRPPVTVNTIKESSAHYNATAQYVPGYTVMFVFYIMISMVRRFFKEKESGMIARLRGTPMRSWEYLIGMWVPFLITVLVQSTVLLGFGHFVYGLYLGDLASIVLIVVSLAICGTGLGLALSFLVRGENQGLGVTQIFTLGGAVLAGLWFPFDLLPDAVQKIGKFTPQYWAQLGLQNVIIRGAQLSDIWVSAAVLLAFGAGGILIALWRYQAFLRGAINS